MPSSNHSRSASQETTTSSYNMILEHLLQYPGSYEIPLRTMYTLNCTPRAQPLPKDYARSTSPNASPRTSPTPGQTSSWNEAETATVNFTSQLMNHISSMPQQPSSLPPSFIVSFVARVLPPSISMVDFPQALTALDYLRDLENRRRREMIAAFERLNIHLDSFEADIEALTVLQPGIGLWANNMQMKDKKAEYYYAKLWLNLRRWIMLNELGLLPFNKLNCMGMLNTLFPPQHGKLPSKLLLPEVLRKERDCFFDYIQQVDKFGPGALSDVVAIESSSWHAVHKDVDKYLKVAKGIIDDSMGTNLDMFKRVEEPRKAKKTDSGVSFGTEPRPSTGSSMDDTRPISPAPSSINYKGLSRLERLTREFKRMRVKTRPDVEEMIKMEQDMSEVEEKGKRLKSVRSLANLRDVNSSMSSLGSRKGSDALVCNPAEIKRIRELYDNQAAGTKPSKKRTK